jgi:hypothetical protein
MAIRDQGRDHSSGSATPPPLSPGAHGAGLAAVQTQPAPDVGLGAIGSSQIVGEGGVSIR